ncbi:hypothetical protein WA026_019919 [Henosepilachna vigintioctopunctata]|uniref:Uncharacterized protein n=1 Tax=Henosepilachna vigintioctopunctata TaxID=420089 RepID=A0AAW1V493_9CUCU
MNAFIKSGICAFNPDVFTEENYAPYFVADRQLLPANSSQAMSNEEPLQPSSSSVPSEIDDQLGPSNIEILPQNNVQPEPVTITTSISVRISEQPQQSAIDQGDVSQAATLTSNSGQEPQSTPEKTNASDVFNPEIEKPSPKAPPRL